jgi:RNA polymerase sigma-70 factor (ECF subfamily)
MPDPTLDTVQLNRCVERLQAGDKAAADELFRGIVARLEHLARRMLRDFPTVRPHADTGDVLQGAAIRLMRMLNGVHDLRPASTRDFFNLVAVQIRRELLDLARHFSGRERSRVPAPDGSADLGPADAAPTPADLELWCRFHEAVEGLPAEEREVVGLIFYHGYTRAQVGELLGVSERTVHRRWQSACVRLNERLGGELPPV